MRTCFMRVPPQEVVTGVEGMVVGMVVIMLGVMGMIVGLVGIMVGVMGLIVGVVRMMVWGAGLAVFVGWFVIYQIFVILDLLAGADPRLCHCFCGCCGLLQVGTVLW